MPTTVRYILTPQLTSSQRIIHRDKHLTIVYGGTVGTAANSANGMRTYLTSKERKYVCDIIERETPNWGTAITARDESFVQCPCGVPPALKYANAVPNSLAALPCPIHEPGAYGEFADWLRKRLSQ